MATGIARRGNGTLPSFFGLSVIGTTLYAGAVDVNGIYRSTDNGETWTPAKNGLTSTFILALVANGSTLYAADNGNGIYRSDDGAATWRRFDAGLTRRTSSSTNVGHLAPRRSNRSSRCATRAGSSTVKAADANGAM